jgi:hypothetical protein
MMAEARTTPDLLSADMRMEVERREWEEQEGRRMPVRPVHFQEVIPGEIRNLGTGYFKFSTDEGERFKQMDQLNELRNEVRAISRGCYAMWPLYHVVAKPCGRHTI